MIKDTIWFLAIGAALMALGYLGNYHPIVFMIFSLFISALVMQEFIPSLRLKNLRKENTRLKEELAITEDTCKTISGLFQESNAQNEALLKLLHHWRDEALKAECKKSCKNNLTAAK